MEYAQKAIRFLKRRFMRQGPHFWEYYGRIKFATDAIQSAGFETYTVLDLGGATGDNLLRKFGVKNVKTLDIKPGADIVASAAKIPVNDNSFDFVTSLDMMEHVPRELRLKVVDEMIRVAKRMVVLVAPVESSENIWAEDFVMKYRFADFLVEHKEQGLVNFAQIELHLEKAKTNHSIKSVQRYELDNLQTWVSLMTEDYVDASEVYEKCYQKLENRFVPRRVGLVIYK